MRIATWNLQNLFTPNAGAGAPITQAAYEAKLDALAATIAAMSPDLMAVQEIGPAPALNDLVTVIGGTWYVATADPDGRGIRVGLISRHPLRDVEQITAFPPGLGPVQVDDDGHTITGLGRPALKGTVTVNGRSVHVISVHLKSKLLSFPNGRFSTDDEDERARYAVYALHRRAAEAAGVRTYTTRLLQQPATAGAEAGTATGVGPAAVVVAGDLNDDTAAATTQLLYGPPGSELGTVGFDRPDTGDRQRLWNVAPLITQTDRYSRNYRGRRELIDHILVSAPSVDAVTAVAVGPGPAPSITDDPDARRNEPGSDHRPLHADFTH